MMKFVPIFTLLYFCSLQAFAQGGMITSFSIQPVNPTEGDEIEIYADVSFPSGGCDLDFIAYPISGTTINATAHHCIGMLTVICNTTDTFELGQLPAGSYTFDLTLTSGAGGPGCSPGFIPDDNDQFQFTVSPAVGIEEFELLKELIYPNPFYDRILLKKPLTSEAIITDINGRIVKVVEPGIQSIDVEALQPAVYIFRYRNATMRLLK